MRSRPKPDCFLNPTATPLHATKRSKWLFGLLIVVVAFVCASLANVALAQTGPATAKLVIDSLEMADFPNQTVSFRLTNASGLLASPLLPDQVAVREDDLDTTPTQFSHTYSGVHLAVAVNPNSELAAVDSQRVSNYARAISTLSRLAPILKDPSNQFSVFFNPDQSFPQLPNFTALMEALNGYQENMNQLNTSLNSLDLAVQYLSGVEKPREKVLLFITPYIRAQTISQFEAIAQKAKANDITLHVWMVNNTGFLDTPAGQRTLSAVENTGGALAVSANNSPFPDPTAYFLGIGYSYTMTYQSQVRSSGKHQFVLAIELGNATQITSIPFEFSLQVEPIHAEFLRLPASLTIIENADGSIAPDSLPIEVALSFPDHHPRPIQSVELQVNGQFIQKNIQPPYGGFVIELNQFKHAPNLSLQVVTIDSLDLQKRSQPVILPLTWDDQAVIRSARRRQLPYWLAGALFVFLLGIAILTMKRQKHPHHTPPETLPTAGEQPLPPGCLAVLTPLLSFDTPSAEKPIEITNPITLIGKGPAQVNLVLHDTALESVHAELRILPDSAARVTDFNTRAGTWVNQTRVSPVGMTINQGDILRFGNLRYRFNSVNKPEQQIRF